MDHFDVIIVGAGLSGIGAAAHLQDRCPETTFAILEARAAIGGTWDLFRYPGIRSDSDMHTLGYSFKPWKEAEAIADGPAIRKYVNETAQERGLTDHIRFEHAVKTASWSSTGGRWTIEVAQQGASGPTQISCNFLFMCGGYYNYAEGFTPDFTGRDSFQGQIVHPQQWPEDLDYSGKKVIVIGSGATAMTLVPAMAEKGAQVTMVQRSPTYVVSRPAKDGIANMLRRFLPEKMAYAATRFKNVQLGRFFYHRTRTRPKEVKKALIDMVRDQLGPDYDVDKHFTPSYDPWDQRLCLVPDADLFEVIKAGKAEVITDHIDCFTPQGLKLSSGEELEADIIVTATGLNLIVLSGVAFSVDGQAVNFPDTFTYKGMMFSGVPNLVQTFGYINASWTLRADLTSEYVCRVVNQLRETGTQICTPTLTDAERKMPAKPWIDDFSPGYMQRLMHLFPKQGDRAPWQNTQDYTLDKKMIRNAPIEDGALVFSQVDKARVSGSPDLERSARVA